MKMYTKNLLLTFSFMVIFSHEIKATEEENTPDVRTPLATAANLNAGIASIEGDGTGTVIVGGTSMTASTNDLSSISRALSAIEGTGFATATDSLKVISDELDLIQDNGNAAGTVITGGTSYTASTNDLTSISRALSAIEGASFASATDSLKAASTNLAYIIANVQIDPITLVNGAKGLAALTTAITLAGAPAVETTTALTAYNNSLTTALTDATTATTTGTQKLANTTTAIASVNTAITNFNAFITALLADAGYAGGTVYISSAYGESQIKWALSGQLLNALQQLQARQA